MVSLFRWCWSLLGDDDAKTSNSPVVVGCCEMLELFRLMHGIMIVMFLLLLQTLDCGGVSLCNSTSIFQGLWTYPVENQNSRKFRMAEPAFSSCPQTRKSIEKHKFLHDQVKQYGCSSYHEAMWQPKHCRLLSLRESFHVLHNPQLNKNASSPKLTVMGDSLSGQFYIAMECAKESRNISLANEYILELVYRRDMPCDPACIGKRGTEFRANASKLMINPCDSCQDGIKHNLKEVQHNTPWLRMISKDTTILVLGGGAWFNYYRGVFNSTAVYKETLKFIAPILGNLTRDRGIEVFWLDLPPCWLDDEVEDHDKKAGYEWDKFSSKNKLAKKTLSPFGVHFIDSWPALDERKKFDGNVSDPGGLHWW